MFTLLLIVLLLLVSTGNAFNSALNLSFHKGKGKSKGKGKESTTGFKHLKVGSKLILHAVANGDKEEKRLQTLASRRERIRSTLKNADSLKKFRISNGKLEQKILHFYAYLFLSKSRY